MTAPRDEQLLADLRAALSPLAAPPAEELKVAKGLFVWRTIDAELAELTHDSLLDGAEGRRTRAAGRPRLLTFQVDGFSIDAEVDAANGARRLIGQIVPPGPADLELQSDAAQAATQTRADDRGRFVLPLPAQETRFRLRCVTAQHVVEMSWVLA